MEGRIALLGTGAGGGPSVAAVVLDDYQLRLPSFEGPLDVLLRLIERNQLPITEISLVAVTQQYLDYVASTVVSSSALADFASTGARLVLLKSRSLLPRPPVNEDDEADSDLVKELIEYQTVKAAAAQLASLDLAGTGAFAHRPDAVAGPTVVAVPRLARHQPRSLVSALRRRLSTAVAPPETIPLRPMVTLRQMAERILERLGGESSVPFSAVVAVRPTRQEILTGFQAVLALVRRRVVVADQPSLFAEITLRQGSADMLETGMGSRDVGD